MAVVNLTSEQRVVAEGVLSGLAKGRPVTTVGGLAGTGKSVLAAYLADRLPSYAVAAFTGKAAHVLCEKGVARARTIHSLIYVPEEVYLRRPGGGLVKGVAYNLRDDLDVAGILVDEASMVSRALYADLTTFGLPVAFLGDHAQLPPVGDDPGLMRDPQFRLETVHRNAGEILHFAAHLRAGQWASRWRAVPGGGRDVSLVAPARPLDHMPGVDQTIVAFNRDRVRLNRQYREQVLHRSGPLPVAGDRLIVLRNTKRFHLRNGQQLTAVDVIDGGLMVVQTGDGRRLEIDYTKAAFNEAKPEFDPDPTAPVPLDFAYAVTCHKAQGSEWQSGLVLEQCCPHWEHPRWAYTAATRFRRRLLWMLPGRKQVA
jgi:exodeoxyribonuclease-5